MNRKTIKRILILVLGGIVIAGGVIFYMFNQPHRNVQEIAPDFTMSASNLVDEYLKDADLANEKYLQDEGESKIIAVSGIIAAIDEDLNHQKIVYLKTDDAKAGVRCAFSIKTNKNAQNLKVGTEITIKGVIRSGAGFDEDLEMYEDVILEKCDVYKKK